MGVRAGDETIIEYSKSVEKRALCASSETIIEYSKSIEKRALRAGDETIVEYSKSVKSSVDSCIVDVWSELWNKKLMKLHTMFIPSIGYRREYGGVGCV